LALFGVVVPTAGKVWLIDRMAILYDDVAPAGSANIAPSPHTSGTPEG
jgi:hypothetical protein